MAHLCMDSCQDANRVYGGVVSRLAWHWGFLLGFFHQSQEAMEKIHLSGGSPANTHHYS